MLTKKQKTFNWILAVFLLLLEIKSEDGDITIKAAK